MKVRSCFSVALGLVSVAVAEPHPTRPKEVTAEALMDKIKLSSLLHDARTLERFAYRYPERNRVFGGRAHTDTVNWLYNELRATKYYNVEVQEQVHTWTLADQKLEVAEEKVVVWPMTYSPPGDTKGKVLLVPNGGCTTADFPPEVEGQIALIQRGGCNFGDKAAIAGSVRAAGAIIYNNVDGEIHGGLGGVSNPKGPFVPTVGITMADGEKIASELRARRLSAHLSVVSQIENRTTYNIIATTKTGDQNNVIMIGAHSDSVNAGPGINDDGSGVVGILNIARALAKFNVKNAVRFAFWTAEEFGLLGSKFYVNRLTPEQRRRIRLYLNFDMIASPNYANLIYDGDGSSFGLIGPPGSAEIEKLFQGYFERLGQAHFPSPFNGRSDYQAFILNGIPAGGIFSGADGIKTEEQARACGGQAGIRFDPNYHGPGDNMTNLNHDAFLRNARGAAFALASYARSVHSLPPKEPPEQALKRWIPHLDDHSDCSDHCGQCTI